MKLNKVQKEKASELALEIAKILFWLIAVGVFLIEYFRKWYFIISAILLLIVVSLFSIFILKGTGVKNNMISPPYVILMLGGSMVLLFAFLLISDTISRRKETKLKTSR